MSVRYRLAELADLLGAELHGDGTVEIHSIATIQSAGAGQICFLANPKYAPFLQTTAASAVIVHPKMADQLSGNGLLHTNPYLLFAQVTRLLNPPHQYEEGIHPSAIISPRAQVAESASIGPKVVIEEGAVIAANTRIGPGCVIGRNSRIGEDCLLHANVTVAHGTSIGNRVILHPGCVIGSDGFGLAKDGRQWVKIEQIGSVILEDDVEVGANTTIDRGALENTVIRRGVKLDNHIQIAHNVEIGENTAIAALTGIAGSTHIGADCTIAGASGVVGHLQICDNVHITAMSLVTKNIDQPGVYSATWPAEEQRSWKKKVAKVRRLEQLEQRLAQLEKKLTEYKG